MFGLENRGETLIFMSRHFNETMTISILHFLRFSALKNLTGDYFVLRINQIIYSKQKIKCFFFILVFSQHFSYISLSLLLCTGWRTTGVWKELYISK